MNESICYKDCPVISAWQNSAHVVWVGVKPDITGIFFKVGLPSGNGFLEPIKGVYHPAKGKYRVYIPAKYFPSGCATFYKIEGVNREGGRVVIGTNILRVMSGFIQDADDSRNEEISKNCHIPLDGEWYRVTVTSDDEGLTYDVDQTAELDGVFNGGTGTAIDKLYDFTVPYSYNKTTGLYHRVTAYKDEYGKVMASVNDEGVEGDDKTFVLDPATGFYYEMNSVTGEHGETLVVGDKR